MYSHSHERKAGESVPIQGGKNRVDGGRQVLDRPVYASEEA
jgi:hypothetical protein